MNVAQDAPAHRAGERDDASPIYELVNVSKTYRNGTVAALSPIDLSIGKGRFVSIIGPSGCGKTTLLKILAGLMPASSGSVKLHGQHVTGPRREIGMMFQTPNLLPWRTTLENVVLPVRVAEGRTGADRARNKARELLELVGLSGFENSYPFALSGGMAQRAAICRMLIGEPSVLLLDEPFGAIDEINRETLNIELQAVCARWQATAVLVTHSVNEAVFLSDEVHVMSARPGRVVETIVVDLPRPRTPDMMETADFARYLTRVRSALRGSFQ